MAAGFGTAMLRQAAGAHGCWNCAPSPSGAGSAGCLPHPHPHEAQAPGAAAAPRPGHSGSQRAVFGGVWSPGQGSDSHPRTQGSAAAAPSPLRHHPNLGTEPPLSRGQGLGQRGLPPPAPRPSGQPPASTSQSSRLQPHPEFPTHRLPARRQDPPGHRGSRQDLRPRSLLGWRAGWGAGHAGSPGYLSGQPRSGRPDFRSFTGPERAAKAPGVSRLNPSLQSPQAVQADSLGPVLSFIWKPDPEPSAPPQTFPSPQAHLLQEALQAAQLSARLRVLSPRTASETYPTHLSYR